MSKIIIENICAHYDQSGGQCTFRNHSVIANLQIAYHRGIKLCGVRGKGGSVSPEVAINQPACKAYEKGRARSQRVKV